MRKKSTSLSIAFTIIGLASICLLGCSKDDKEVVTPIVVTPKINPIVTWENPADCINGTPLSASQLNATANVPGTFVYTPEIGTILKSEISQTIKVDFTPTDTAKYNRVSKTVNINVIIRTKVENNLVAGTLATIAANYLTLCYQPYNHWHN